MDKQYVKIQDPPASGYNRFVFKRDAEQQPTGFLSYSANGTVTVIYLPRFFFFFFPNNNNYPRWPYFIWVDCRVQLCTDTTERKKTSCCCKTKWESTWVGRLFSSEQVKTLLPRRWVFVRMCDVKMEKTCKLSRPSAYLFFFFFCLQVANAAKFGASAVLIYADPSDYSFEENTQLFGHVSECFFFFPHKK